MPRVASGSVNLGHPVLRMDGSSHAGSSWNFAFDIHIDTPGGDPPSKPFFSYPPDPPPATGEGLRIPQGLRVPRHAPRYREDVTRWHSMIFQVFTKGGSEHEGVRSTTLRVRPLWLGPETIHVVLFRTADCR